MGKTVLVVDDDPGIARLVSMMVERAGYTAVQASGGEEAIEKYATLDLDLILLDLAMPGMDGYAVLQEIRHREQMTGAPRIPIVLLTAYVKSAIKDEDLLQQVDGVINKPVTTQKLVAELTSIMGENA